MGATSDADSCCRQNLHQGIAAGPVPWPGHTDVQEGLLNPYINWPVSAISLPLSPQSEQDRVRSSSLAPSSSWRTTPRRLRSWEYRPRCTTQSASAHLSAPLARSDHLQSGSGPDCLSPCGYRLSTHCAELWALRSLGHEILGAGSHPNTATVSGTSWLA